MRQQKTYDNLSQLTKNINSSLSIISKKIPIDKLNMSIRTQTNEEHFCQKHNNNFSYYCISCKKDICNVCSKNEHQNHKKIDYNEISFDSNEIDYIKESYQKYKEDYDDFIFKINEWKENLENVFTFFKDYVQNNILNKISVMINNYNIDKLNLKSIIKFRMIYSFLTDNLKTKEKNNEFIERLNSYLDIKTIEKFYLESEKINILSKEKLNELNNIINEGNFLENSNSIINLLWCYIKHFNHNEESTTISSSQINNKKNKEIKQLNLNQVKLSSLKDQQILFNNKMKNKRKLIEQKRFQNRSATNLCDLINNSKNVYEKKKTNNNYKIENNIFLSNEEIPNICCTIPNIEQTQNYTISKTERKLKKIYRKNFISRNENNIYNYQTMNNKRYNSNDMDLNDNNKKLTQFFNENNNATLPNGYYYNTISVENMSINRKKSKINCTIEDKEISCSNNDLSKAIKKKSKIYVHKKFNSTVTGCKNTNLLNNLQFANNIFDSIDIPSSYETLVINSVSSNGGERKTKIKNSENYNEKNENEIKIVKEFLINPNKDVYIGFELGNSECKIGILNQITKEVELFYPFSDKEDNFKNCGIANIISFDESTENISIGNIEQNSENHNNWYSVFNLLKFFGKNTTEIIGKKQLWPFKIYNNIKTGKPYIKVNFCNNKTKVYNAEDLLTLYLKKIFDLLFSKINFQEISNYSNNSKIELNLVVTVPNCFNYFQRKFIEKIFRTQIFPQKNNKKRNNNDNNLIKINDIFYYDLILKNLKIESCSNLGYLYMLEKLNKLSINFYNNKILIINIEGSSTNISIIEIEKLEKNLKYEIKGIDSLPFGEEDFTDTYMQKILSGASEKIRNELNNCPDILSKLRQFCELAKKSFIPNSQNKINIKKLIEVTKLKLTYNKKDYEDACNDYFEKIYNLIKSLIIKTKISENQINDVVFTSNEASTFCIRQKISFIFRKNDNVYNKLISYNSYDYPEVENYTIIGATLHSANLFSNEIKKYKFVDISPISFGIEGPNNFMDFVIKKGHIIPTKINKLVKIKKPKGNIICINVYEGENTMVFNNKLISKTNINIQNLNLKVEKNMKDYIEVLMEFVIDSNFNLSVFILDSKSLKKEFECIFNIDIGQ